MNAQVANMRILRWRLKLAEYDYDIVYKTGKTNINADALSRNLVNFEETECRIINENSSNSNSSENTRKIAELLEESEEEEEENFELRFSDDENSEDEDFELRLSEDEQFENMITGDNQHTDSILFSEQELNESPKILLTEKALIHNPMIPQRMQTRSQTVKEKFNDSKNPKQKSLNKIKRMSSPVDRDTSTERKEKEKTEEEDEEKDDSEEDNSKNDANDYEARESKLTRSLLKIK